MSLFPSIDHTRISRLAHFSWESEVVSLRGDYSHVCMRFLYWTWETAFNTYWGEWRVSEDNLAICCNFDLTLHPCSFRLDRDLGTCVKDQRWHFTLKFNTCEQFHRVGHHGDCCICYSSTWGIYKRNFLPNVDCKLFLNYCLDAVLKCDGDRVCRACKCLVRCLANNSYNFECCVFRWNSNKFVDHRS